MTSSFFCGMAGVDVMEKELTSVYQKKKLLLGKIVNMGKQAREKKMYVGEESMVNSILTRQYNPITTSSPSSLPLYTSPALLISGTISALSFTRDCSFSCPCNRSDFSHQSLVRPALPVAIPKLCFLSSNNLTKTRTETGKTLPWDFRYL